MNENFNNKYQSKHSLEIEDNPPKTTRRDIIKSLATTPILGVFGYLAYRKKRYEKILRDRYLDEFDIFTEETMETSKNLNIKSDRVIRLGIIGFGIRGEQLVRASGFATEEWIEKNKGNGKHKIFNEQKNLKIVYNGVCDLFDVRAKKAIETVGKQAKRYRCYKDMIKSDEIDAVIIASPDHWHAKMIIDAAKAGKHVYVEKCMTRTIEETFEVVDSVKESGIVFQLGHQNRQNQIYNKAKYLIGKNVFR